MRTLILFLFTISLYSNYTPSFSNIQKNNSQTKIKSKVINVKRKSGKIIFKKDAIIENNDTSILANKIIVFYDENKKNDKTSIKKIDALGNVKIFNEEFVATGEKGFYNPQEELFTITENVIFNNGSSIANGEKFIYNLKSKRGFLVGDKTQKKNLHSKRVTLIINENND